MKSICQHYNLMRAVVVSDAIGKGYDVFPCKFSTKLPRQRQSLTAQDDFSKNIAVARSKLCRLGMYLGNVE